MNATCHWSAEIRRSPSARARSCTSPPAECCGHGPSPRCRPLPKGIGEHQRGCIHRLGGHLAGHRPRHDHQGIQARRELAFLRQECVRQASDRAPRDQCGVSNDGTTRCVMMSKIRCHCAIVAVAASPVVRAADVTTRRLAGTTMMNCPPQPFARVKAWPAT